MHSPIYSLSLSASGKSGWSLFDDALSAGIVFLRVCGGQVPPQPGLTTLTFSSRRCHETAAFASQHAACEQLIEGVLPRVGHTNSTSGSTSVVTVNFQ